MNLLRGDKKFLVLHLINLLLLIVFYSPFYEPLMAWDSPEWALSGTKMMIPHPPGAPVYSIFYQLLFHVFSLFGTEALQSGYYLNLISAVCLYFLVYQISMKLFREKGLNFKILVSLTALFFLISPTIESIIREVEVYSFSLVVFCIQLFLALKYKEESDNRLLLILALVAGLGTGVHFLSLLALPVALFIILDKIRIPFLRYAGALAVVPLILLVQRIVLFLLSRIDLLLNNLGFAVFMGAGIGFIVLFSFK